MVDWAAEGKVMPDFAKLEERKGQGAQQEGDLPQWAARQQKVFTNWINNKVAERPLSVCDLFVDLQDGTVLYGLLEVLSKQSLAVLGKVKPEKNKIKKIANMNIVWKFLLSTVKLVGIGPTDIVDGNVTLTLGMIWSLIVFFMAKDLGDAGDGLGVLKRRIMEWITKRTRDYPDVNVSNFTTSLADGSALLAILEDADPDECPYEPSDNPADNLRRAFDDFSRLYGVGAILDPDDPQCCDDEKANITYLAEVMKAMPDLGDEEDGDGEGGGRRKRRLKGEAAEKDTQKAAVVRAEEMFPAALENLRALCVFGPEDGDSCAAKVAEMMESAGLTGVKVVKPSQDREDPSMRGDAFVVGEKAGPPGTPTVLFYASYGTVDESAAASANVEAHHHDGENGAEEARTKMSELELWASDPLCLTPAAGTPKEGAGARVVARGASQDKANVACQLTAVEALLKGSAPCGVKIVVGATPPPAATVGNASLEVADRFADFLRAHPSVAGLPDLIVVSEPAGSCLAPEKNAVLVGCRGFATVRVSVSTFEDGKNNDKRGCAEYGGPLIDPARVLTTILASLHDSETGALKVEGLSAMPDEASIQRLKGLQYGERQLRVDTDYSSTVACAKEAYVQGGEQQPIPASIVEQLTLLPAATVTSVRTTPGVRPGGGGLLASTFPSTASAVVHLCLPPGQEHSSAVQAFQTHCVKHASHGAQVRFDKTSGKAGWLASPNASLVDGVLASLQGGGDEEEEGEGGVEGEGVGPNGRDTLMASNPGFSAVPSAFARALPSATVVGVGVNDPKSKGGSANESVLVDDLKDFVRGTVRVVHGLAKSVKAASGVGGEEQGQAAGHDNDQAVAAGGRSRSGSSSSSGPYTNRYMDDLDRRNAVNSLRGRRSKSPSPSGSAATSPRAAARSPTRGSSSCVTPVKPPLSPVFGGRERNAKHPLSPSRPPANMVTSPSTPVDTPTGFGGLDANMLGARTPIPLPSAPSSAMAAYAASSLSQALGSAGMGAGGFGAPGAAAMAALEGDDDDKVGGGTPKTILKEINELRADPRAYATKLEALVQYYDKTMYHSPTGPPVQTTEGTKPLLESIATLKATVPLEPLKSKEGMQQASDDHVKDLADGARTGHSGCDGSKAADRMNRYGQFFQVAGEVCTYFDATAEGIVAQLLVSDGERSRHNRKALLAPHFKVCGIALGKHPTVGVACVITLAGGYGPRPLGHATDVVCAAKEKPSAEFREVLESVPVPQITEEVNKCLVAGVEVQLKYAPGSIKCIFVQASGARKSMGCQWA